MSRSRTPGSTHHQVAMRLPADLLEALAVECSRRLISRELLVEFLLRAGLQHLPPIDHPTTPTETVEP